MIKGFCDRCGKELEFESINHHEFWLDDPKMRQRVSMTVMCREAVFEKGKQAGIYHICPDCMVDMGELLIHLHQNTPEQLVRSRENEPGGCN